MSRQRRAPGTNESAQPEASDFTCDYPNIAKWVNGYGWIEMGDDLPGLPQRSFIRALDEALGTWMREELGE